MLVFITTFHCDIHFVRDHIWIVVSKTFVPAHDVQSLSGCLDTEMNHQAGKVGVSFAIIGGEELSPMQYGVVFLDLSIP